MIIGFDLDGVIADHTLAKIKLAADLGCNISEKETPSEIFNHILPNEILKVVQGNLYNKVHPNSFLMSGADEAISKIKTLGIKYFLISRRMEPESAIGFLEKYNLWPQYFDKSNSFFVLEKEDKDTKSKELGVTHYFDDEFGVLEKLKSVSNKFLFDSHGVFPENALYTKVSSWEDIKKQLHI